MKEIISLCLLSLLTLTGCSSKPSLSQQTADVAKIPGCFSTLEQLKVVEYDTGSRDVFAYRRGAFTKSNQTRFYAAVGTKKLSPFDAKAKEDLTTLEQAIASTGVQLANISKAQYNSKGKLVLAEFALPADFGRFTYVYSPRYRTLPPDQPNESGHNRINNDWYFKWEDWN